MIINNRLYVKKTIGKGQFARIYKAVDLELKKYVALKVIDKRLAKDKYDEKQQQVFNRLIKT